jgi:VanZ family protein
VKIPYGTTIEKALLCGVFLLAAATSAAILLREQLFSFPYLGLPLYLVLCVLVLACLPTGQTSGELLSRGLYRALPALFLMSAIFHASSFTFLTNPSFGFERSDLLLHFSEFFALGLLTARMVAPNINEKHSLRSFLLASSIVLGYGLLDEIHQGFVPGRDPDGLDWLVDASGGLLGVLAYPVLYRGTNQSSSSSSSN